MEVGYIGKLSSELKVNLVQDFPTGQKTQQTKKN